MPVSTQVSNSGGSGGESHHNSRSATPIQHSSFISSALSSSSPSSSTSDNIRRAFRRGIPTPATVQSNNSNSNMLPSLSSSIVTAAGGVGSTLAAFNNFLQLTNINHRMQQQISASHQMSAHSIGDSARTNPALQWQNTANLLSTQHQHQNQHQQSQPYYLPSTHQMLLSRRTHNSTNSSSISSSSRPKTVYILNCIYCSSSVCTRAMKAILLADTKMELFSTDCSPPSTSLIEPDYFTSTCKCQIRDLGCKTCGNVLGYHVTQPCERCLEAKNNGHFWMFFSYNVAAKERRNTENGKIVDWNSVGGPDAETEAGKVKLTYLSLCR